jgi:selenocysteine lyase/cysteine desulfurase
MVYLGVDPDEDRAGSMMDRHCGWRFATGSVTPAASFRAARSAPSRLYDAPMADDIGRDGTGPGSMTPEALIELIRDSVIGDDQVIEGPFGRRRVTYADYTASGRSLSFLEDHIRRAVLPRYANTHTESSGTGLQTTRFREEARAIIAEALGADRERYAVVFTGSGSTGAIHKLVDVLGLRLPADLDERYRLRDRIPPDERPVVLIGPYEHHSNELPWRESIADVVTIHEDADGRIDLRHLEQELIRHADRPLRIGSFSAASNVTGILSDTRAVSVLLHRHGALSLWDFAAAAPYVDIRMESRRPAPDGDASEADLDTLDAVFISTHKLIGGPGTPGVLVARRDLFRNRVPTVVGGGTVAYVNQEEHRYLDDVEHREEAGTPDIVGAIRAGLVFQLKGQVGEAAIAAREGSFIARAIERWEGVPQIGILGDRRARRLSIVSFTVGHGERKLHHNLVVALLNDLFGIQARGGCSCAGPYGHRLLGIDLATSHRFEAEILRGYEGVKPGWVRVSFNYFLSETVFRYLLDAVELVATLGWRLAPQYRLDAASGLWRYTGAVSRSPLSLRDIRYADGAMRYQAPDDRLAETALEGHLAEARALCADPPAPPAPPQSAADLDVDDLFHELRWFLMPDEAAQELADARVVATRT